MRSPSLSYLIKETNFNHLKEFKDNYRLLKSLVVDSKKFVDAKGASFLIAISLYQLDGKRMSYEDIKNFSFELEDGRKFSLTSFQFLTGLVSKYPKKSFSSECLNNLFFFTFRDINSIMRNRTFISELNQYSVPIEKNKLKYYAYIDYFKEEFQEKIPFYLRNMDISIYTYFLIFSLKISYKSSALLILFKFNRFFCFFLSYQITNYCH
ncbi:MAG: hypothetical protein MRERC_1c165 [Mycoplasmataceae bacterium RC_NB112A]|nr:MAG: hypothetical protein MRERC_1c165 [Mycoplasmataceae bacterium RC_NB112A]